jgi:hypothetical protein
MKKITCRQSEETRFEQLSNPLDLFSGVVGQGDVLFNTLQHIIRSLVAFSSSISNSLKSCFLLINIPEKLHKPISNMCGCWPLKA